MTPQNGALQKKRVTKTISVKKKVTKTISAETPKKVSYDDAITINYWYSERSEVKNKKIKLK